jgi:5-methyltetrahydrofolate--homocysteine methyltransferase
MGTFENLLAERSTLLIDGAMGTELFARGLTAGDPPEMWNIDMPDSIVEVHRGYIDAGSDIILTNSFGGSSFRLKLHNLQDRARELNAAAATCGRQAADSVDRTVVVAGSMGPSGELMEPMGELTPESCAAAFAEQAAGLADGGADLLWIETMSSLDEVKAVVDGARRTTDLPIAATMSFDTVGRTMMGVSGRDAAEQLGELGLVAIGANCGNNIVETEQAVTEIKLGAGDLPVIVKANAGIPEFRGDELTYTGSPEVMGSHLQRMRDVGIAVIGGCCGTSTGHIAYMRQVLDGEIEAPDIAAPGPTRPDDDPGGAAGRSGRQRRRRRAA